ncbi:hypothetical protein AADEFJLK_04458 [Methylovulum psychrotolerans]|uniref:Uncharacterized protein n=1 Tax=Methylovulum psychrotolerans TaxID=1704499 RepID=A0A2S5CGB5_9GAMM|nr:hypothetical protein AADEFJLK_04458 [Methylovulum psychrotolerans]
MAGSRVHPPTQANRVALGVSARLRVISALVIIEQPALAVDVLAREAQVVAKCSHPKQNPNPPPTDIAL